MGSKINKKEIDFIRKNQHLKNVEIANILKVNPKTISLWRKKLGLEPNYGWNDFRQWNEYICKNYKKRTSSSLAKEIGCSVSYVAKVWRENSLHKDNTYQYFLNDDYFEKIDSRQKAYWAGFIAADGCVYQREGHQGLIQISLNSIDLETLENFKRDIEATHLINFDKTKNHCSISITSNKMFNDLQKYGIIPKKTWQFDMELAFKEIGKKYFPDFIRGYFDGEGSVVIRKQGSLNSGSYLSIAIPKNSGLVLQAILKREYGIELKFQEDKRENYYSQPFGALRTINTIQRYTFSSFLYPLEEEYGMTRKKEKILAIKRFIEENKTNRSENKIAVSKWEELRENLKGQSAAKPDEPNESSLEGSTTND